MKVITIKLNEESWAYIIADSDDMEFIEKQVKQLLEIAKARYSDCKVQVLGVHPSQLKQIQQQIERKEETCLTKSS
ncbi:MAG: hypothetical protein HPY60_11065 [Candidatus Methanofastidiosum sp.]|nr:hypothetical protein [Methanofastidiosum sp.]